jgi:hypothetical protein
MLSYSASLSLRFGHTKCAPPHSDQVKDRISNNQQEISNIQGGTAWSHKTKIGITGGGCAHSYQVKEC